MFLISACLCGINCKYNGHNNFHPDLYRLFKCGAALPVCPEQLGGLATPRPAAEIQGGNGQDVWQKKAGVYTSDGMDVTLQFIKGARETLYIGQSINATRAILKSFSPSCGVGYIYNGCFIAKKVAGHGVTAALLENNGIQVCSDKDYTV